MSRLVNDEPGSNRWQCVVPVDIESKDEELPLDVAAKLASLEKRRKGRRGRVSHSSWGGGERKLMVAWENSHWQVRKRVPMLGVPNVYMFLLCCSLCGATVYELSFDEVCKSDPKRNLVTHLRRHLVGMCGHESAKEGSGTDLRRKILVDSGSVGVSQLKREFPDAVVTRTGKRSIHETSCSESGQLEEGERKKAALHITTLARDLAIDTSHPAYKGLIKIVGYA